VRIIIADDAALIREGLTRLVAEMGHEVIASVASAPDLLAAVASEAPDVVVTDIRMPPRNEDDGLRAALTLRASHPGLPVLLLSQHAERAYAEELLADGVGGVGYLLKDRVGDLGAFARALETVASGGTILDPEIAQQLVRQRGADGPLERLTARERQVLTLMAEGRTNAAIGSALFLSDGAVEKHISGIFAKLDLPADMDGHRRVLAVLTWLRSK
jgi:DNA-binding NarL/FixJ family response regulator